MNASRTPPPALAWTAFALLSLALFGNYYVYDAVGPVADLLQKQMGFSDSQIGLLNAVYSLPNIVLVLAGGMLVDRFGAGLAIFVLAMVCLVGALITAFAPDFGTMVAGRLVFGLGAESMIVAITVAIAQWFRSATLGLAMGLNLSFGRLGSYGADLSPTLAAPLYAEGFRGPLQLAAVFALLAAVAAGLFWWVERRARTRHGLLAVQARERFVWRDVLRFRASYWYVVVLCVAFYAVIFPFRSTFAIKYFQHAHGLALDAASLMNSHVFLAAIVATPLFGYIADRWGHRALLMAFGALLLPLSFAILAATHWSLWITTVLIGVSFSLVPAVLWPSTTFLVEPARFGTAFGLMTMLQNAGMGLSNVVAGFLNDHAGASEANPSGYHPMLAYFGLLSLAGFAFALLLDFRERERLEKPRPLSA
jgi:MFS family permease